MKTKFQILIPSVFLILFGCEIMDNFRNHVDLNVTSINLFIDEVLDVNNNPVCLRFNISSTELFENNYLLEEDVSVTDNTITIEIQDIQDLGKCEYPEYSSVPKIDTIDYLCQAQSKYFTIDNLAKGYYTVNINIQENSFNGSLNLSDQMAKFDFQGNDVVRYDSIIHIVPDSTLFGTYVSLNDDSAGFNEFVNKLLESGCKTIELQSGKYRAFEIDNSGNVIFNSSQIRSEHTFIFKYDLNIDEILKTIKDYIDTSEDGYCVIMHDNLMHYYNIKDDPN